MWGFWAVAQAEFDGCDPEQPDSCEATCELLEQRHNTIQAPASEVEVLTTRCGVHRGRSCDNGGLQSCHVVARIDDRCLAGSTGSLIAADCARPAEEVLAEQFEACSAPDDIDGGI